MAEASRQKATFEQEEDTQQGKFLTFSIGREVYGLEITFVTEIIGIQPITEIPEMPNFIRGIINLRGKIIPIMDARLRFKKQFWEYNDRTCIIVININSTVLGLIVDSVSEVLSIQDEEIVPPQELKAAKNRYIKGIGKVGDDIKLLLDVDKLLNYDEVEKIEYVNQGRKEDEVVL